MKTKRSTEVIIQKKTNNIVCVQKPKQYYYTIPHCKKGNVGGYCIIHLKSLAKHIPVSKIPKKSCRKKHLTVNDHKTRKQKKKTKK